MPHDGSDNTRYAFGSLVITALLCTILWIVLGHVRVSVFGEAGQLQRRPQRLEVRSIDPEDLLRRERRQQPDYVRRVLTEPEKKIAEIFRKDRVTEPPKQELEAAITKGLGRNVVDPLPPEKALDPNALPTPAMAPLPAIITIDESALDNSRRRLPGRRTIRDVKRVPLEQQWVPGLAVLDPTGPEPPPPKRVELGGMEIRLPERRAPIFPAPADKPTTVLPEDGPIPDNPDTKPIVDTTNSRQIDHLLDIRFTKHPDAARGGGYYELVINTRRASESIVAMDRDVLFLVDASASIGHDKLFEFRRGLTAALDYLGPRDRFNVVAFRDEPTPCFDDFVTPTTANVAAAAEFLDGLRSKGKTDVFAGIAPYIATARTTDRPYMVFLLSDGKTTTGSKLTNQEFLRRTAAENVADANIFTFSAGEEANLFLLEYLAYKSRGFSFHWPRIVQAAPELTSFVGGLSDVLVADLQYSVSGGVEKETYPRRLPNLYRGHPLTVWGRYGEDEKQVAVQIWGRDRNGNLGELAAELDIAKAEDGGDDLATRWAAQKIYWLMSQWAVGRDAEIRGKIDELAQDYGIVVPY